MQSAICEVIGAEPDMEVVGRSSNVADTLKLARELNPDVVVTDVWMPGGGGPEVCEGVRRMVPAAVVVAVSASSFASTEASMMQAGAKAFLLKDAVALKLPEVIRQACSVDSAAAESTTLATEPSAKSSAVIVTDRFGTICGWDAGAEELYGWTAFEVLGRPIFEIPVGPNELEQAAEIMGRLASGEKFEGQFTVTRKNGTSFLANVVTTPIIIDHVVQCLVGISQPVDES